MIVIVILIISRVLKLLNRNKKFAKCLQTTGWMDILYCHSGYLKLCPPAACSACKCRPCKYFPKSDADESKYRKTVSQTDKQIDRNIRLTGPHRGPSDPGGGGG